MKVDQLWSIQIKLDQDGSIWNNLVQMGSTYVNFGLLGSNCYNFDHFGSDQIKLDQTSLSSLGFLSNLLLDISLFSLLGWLPKVWRGTYYQRFSTTGPMEGHFQRGVGSNQWIFRRGYYSQGYLLPPRKNCTRGWP